MRDQRPSLPFCVLWFLPCPLSSYLPTSLSWEVSQSRVLKMASSQGNMVAGPISCILPHPHCTLTLLVDTWILNPAFCCQPWLHLSPTEGPLSHLPARSLSGPPPG